MFIEGILSEFFSTDLKRVQHLQHHTILTTLYRYVLFPYSLAIIVVVVIAVMVGGSLVFRTHFHHEFQGENINFVWLDIEGLEDTELTIDFSNTTSLCYSIDIVTYDRVSTYGLFSQQPGTFEDTTHVRIWPDVRIKSMNITLRDDTRYNIDVDQGTNLNSLVMFSNNASMTNKLEYEATGNISIYLDEDCFSTDEHWTEFRVGERISPSIISLYADLPTGVEGTLQYSSGATFTLLSSSGWSYQGSNEYATFNSGYPEKEVLFDLKATQQYVIWLSD